MSEGTTRYLGLDVHKATITVAVAEASGPPTAFGTIANEVGAVRRLVRQLGREAKLVAAYEAGPTGYALHRELTRLGVECMVVAPGLIPIRPGDRRVETRTPRAAGPAPPPPGGAPPPLWAAPSPRPAPRAPGPAPHARPCRSPPAPPPPSA